MASGHRSGGVDFDDLFEPDVIGDGPTAGFLRRADGTPLRYAHAQYGTIRADVGRRTGGVDVARLWAAKGTASYVSDGGWGGRLNASDVGKNSAKATAAFSFRPDGTTFWSSETGGGSGTNIWTRSKPGDYDILFTLIQNGSSGYLNATLDQWLPLTQERFVSLTVSASGGRSASASRTLRGQIRRRQDGRVWMDKQMQFFCTVASDG
ncbi:hypothetical protein J5226_21185 [Lysobacter sp. K5869]|uniref:hypothetical protein n=1 Tax=Lysobacter sp. K5869 TaxID=2820808 RepID=UPI001C062B0F|nr:hypothetical protein [Lysobacter sp. K5869]QWP76081.1 hypothetical protein J5226_21185 [Lysobacter sp. K5869]